MKTLYRGFEISVTRELSLIGEKNLYFSIFRESDGLCIEDSFSTGEDTVREFVGYIKERVDAFIETKGESEDLAEEFNE